VPVGPFAMRSPPSQLSPLNVSAATASMPREPTGHVDAIGFPSEALILTGELKCHKSQGDSGNIMSRGFCPNYGSPILAKSSGHTHIPRFSLAASMTQADLCPKWSFMPHAAMRGTLSIRHCRSSPLCRLGRNRSGKTSAKSSLRTKKGGASALEQASALERVKS
jgi:hypothetical protein